MSNPFSGSSHFFRQPSFHYTTDLGVDEFKKRFGLTRALYKNLDLEHALVKPENALEGIRSELNSLSEKVWRQNWDKKRVEFVNMGYSDAESKKLADLFVESILSAELATLAKKYPHTFGKTGKISEIAFQQLAKGGQNIKSLIAGASSGDAD